MFLHNPYFRLSGSSPETCWKPHCERGFPACFHTTPIPFSSGLHRKPAGNHSPKGVSLHVSTKHLFPAFRALIGNLVETTFRKEFPCIFSHNPYSKLLESSSETCWKDYKRCFLAFCYTITFFGF